MKNNLKNQEKIALSFYTNLADSCDWGRGCACKALDFSYENKKL